jgi:hypothetical protein
LLLALAIGLPVWSQSVLDAGVLVLDLRTFNGYPMEGDAKSPDEQALNCLRNRWVAPTGAQFDRTITLETLLASRDDRSRWSEQKACSVEGICVGVSSGAAESANGHKWAENARNTRIELTLHATDPSRRITVEVTPRWRHVMCQLGHDWSTASLKERLLGKRIRVAGWLLFDPVGPGKTAWSIHPVTRIEAVLP